MFRISNENYMTIFRWMESSLSSSFTYINNISRVACNGMKSMFFTYNNVLMTIQTVYISTTEYLLYLLYLQTFKDFVIRLAIKLSKLNMIYTKLFQWVYLESFFTDEDIKKTFQSFTDNVKVEEDEIDYTIIRKLLKEVPALHFTSTKPFHAGTVSVTFQARLQDNPVIIKILRKGIDENLKKTVEFLVFVSRLLSHFPYICDLQLSDILTENIDSLLSQSDLNNEGRETEKFHHCLSEHEHLYCPSVYYVSKEALVQEYVYGSNIYDLVHLDEDTRKTICSSVYEFIFHSMCDLGTFHGDMHPGNVLFVVDTPCTSSNDDFTVNFIDYGITYHVQEQRRMKIMKIIWMLTEADDFDFFNYLYDQGIQLINSQPTNCLVASKEEIVAELVELRKAHDMFRNTIKPLDIYYTNKVLIKYKMRIHPEFSRAFMFLYSMCSLMSMLQSVDMTLYKKCLTVYFAMNHEKLRDMFQQ